jgi:hypothetical protein
MKKSVHEYTDQELTSMSTEQSRELQRACTAEIQMGEWKEFSNAIEEDYKKSCEKTEELNIHSPEFLRQT